MEKKVKIKLKNSALSGLLALQQIVESSSQALYEFFQRVEKHQKEGHVSKEYCDELEVRLHAKVSKNNHLSSLIDEEIHERAVSIFGKDVTTHKILPSLIKEHDMEVEAYKKLAEKRAEKVNKEVRKLDTSVSKEKKHDNSKQQKNKDS